jgi:EcsC protein family
MERAADRALELERVEPVPGSLWQRIRAEPERAPEHIALAAAERFAPAAERWVPLMRGRRKPTKVARIAYRKHVRLARLEGGALGLGGAFTAVPDLAALAWIQSRMVFFIAAAYGYDPYDPMRPAELLALQGVYPTAVEARAALDGMGTPLAQALVESRLRGSDEQIATRLVKLVGRQVAKRAALRLVPILASPLSAVQNAGATKELGKRALAYYGG